MDSRLVVSRGDVALREVDVASLAEGRWLTDAVLTWRLAELQQEAPDNVLLVDASVAFFLSHCALDDVAVVATPLSLSERTLVLCPVSDNAAPAEAYGGTHWALLAFWPLLRSFKLYDSMGRTESCYANAKAIAAALAKACSLPPGVPLVEDGRAPRQANSFDCALHALLAAEALVDSHTSGKSTDAAIQAITPGAARALRSQVLAGIEELAASGPTGDLSLND